MKVKVKLTEKDKKIVIVETVIAVILILAVIVMGLILTPVIIEGNSMNPNYIDGQLVFVYKTKDIKIMDVIVFQRPGETYKVMKRVLGVEGDRIQIKYGELYRNGEKVTEQFSTNSRMDDMDEIIIGENQVFVLGDNRDISLDSRNYGCVGLKRILGRVL